jgi:CTP synthase
MRLGKYEAALATGSHAQSEYGRPRVEERHRHRYEFNNKYRQQLEDAGLVVSGTSPDGSLVEIMEIADHPFMLGSQFHPEFRSRPDRPQPLFRDFVGAAKLQRAGVDAGFLTQERERVPAGGSAGAAYSSGA